MTSRPLPVRLSPRPVRALSRRLRASRAASDLRAHGFLLVSILVILTTSTLIALTTRGLVWTPSGYTHVPSAPTTSVPSCGDYCGTDAIFTP